MYASFHPDYQRHRFGGPSAGSLAEHVVDLQARHPPVTRPSPAFFQVRDGKVAEGWIVSDGGGFLAQLRGEA